MDEIRIATTGKQLVDYVTFLSDGRVDGANESVFPTLHACPKGSLKLYSINDVRIRKPSAELKAIEQSSKKMNFVFRKCTEAPQESDEFDINSDEDESSFQPRSFLPHPTTNQSQGKNSTASIILDAVKKCQPGNCIIIMSEGCNPALPIAQASVDFDSKLMYIDTVTRMKTRQKIDEAGALFMKALKNGLWIYVERATKSITLLEKLAECIQKAKSCKTELDEKSRVFLMCEPHPHFPEYLLQDSITLRCHVQGSSLTVDTVEDAHEGTDRLNAIHGVDSADPPPQPKGKAPTLSNKKKSVKISAEVEVVPLEKSHFLELSASAAPPKIPSESDTNLQLMSRYKFGASERFISLCRVSDGRYAVGTTSGYVVILDSDGLPLIHFRPHKSCVWDVAFASQFDFCTACEDGSSTIFHYFLRGREVSAISIASFHADVFAVAYASPVDPQGVVFSGGLSATICALHSDRRLSTFISTSTSVQALCSLSSNFVVAGGGSGQCSLIDSTRCELIAKTDLHSRKVPAAASASPNIVYTGGFDKVCRIWDVRSGSFYCTSQIDSADVVTAVAVSDNYLGMCTGTQLLVYDQRSTSNPIGKQMNAWRELTRGLVIEDGRAITASVDGVVRFWDFNGLRTRTSDLKGAPFS